MRQLTDSMVASYRACIHTANDGVSINTYVTSLQREIDEAKKNGIEVDPMYETLLQEAKQKYRKVTGRDYQPFLSVLDIGDEHPYRRF